MDTTAIGDEIELDKSTQSQLPRKFTYRIRGIPLEHGRRGSEALLRLVLRLDVTQSGIFKIKSLASSPDRRTKTATADFSIRPTCFPPEMDEWEFQVPDINSDDETDDDDDKDFIPKKVTIITVDSHFHGLTVLRSFKEDSEHTVEYYSP